MSEIIIFYDTLVNRKYEVLLSENVSEKTWY